MTQPCLLTFKWSLQTISLSFVLAYRSRVFTRLEYGEFRWLSALLLSEWNNRSL